MSKRYTSEERIEEIVTTIEHKNGNKHVRESKSVESTGFRSKSNSSLLDKQVAFPGESSFVRKDVSKSHSVPLHNNYEVGQDSPIIFRGVSTFNVTNSPSTHSLTNSHNINVGSKEAIIHADGNSFIIKQDTKEVVRGDNSVFVQHEGKLYAISKKVLSETSPVEVLRSCAVSPASGNGKRTSKHDSASKTTSKSSHRKDTKKRRSSSSSSSSSSSGYSMTSFPEKAHEYHFENLKDNSDSVISQNYPSVVSQVKAPVISTKTPTPIKVASPVVTKCFSPILTECPSPIVTKCSSPIVTKCAVASKRTIPIKEAVAQVPDSVVVKCPAQTKACTPQPTFSVKSCDDVVVKGQTNTQSKPIKYIEKSHQSFSQISDVKRSKSPKYYPLPNQSVAKNVSEAPINQLYLYPHTPSPAQQNIYSSLVPEQRYRNEVPIKIVQQENHYSQLYPSYPVQQQPIRHSTLSPSKHLHQTTTKSVLANDQHLQRMQYHDDRRNARNIPIQMTGEHSSIRSNIVDLVSIRSSPVPQDLYPVQQKDSFPEQRSGYVTQSKGSTYAPTQQKYDQQKVVYSPSQEFDQQKTIHDPRPEYDQQKYNQQKYLQPTDQFKSFNGVRDDLYNKKNHLDSILKNDKNNNGSVISSISSVGKHLPPFGPTGVQMLYRDNHLETLPFKPDLFHQPKPLNQLNPFPTTPSPHDDINRRQFDSRDNRLNDYYGRSRQDSVNGIQKTYLPPNQQQFYDDDRIYGANYPSRRITTPSPIINEFDIPTKGGKSPYPVKSEFDVVQTKGSKSPYSATIHYAPLPLQQHNQGRVIKSEPIQDERNFTVTSSGIEIVLDASYFSPSEIRSHLDDSNILHVSAERLVLNPNTLRTERKYLKRKFAVPYDINAGSLQIIHSVDGKLTITGKKVQQVSDYQKYRPAHARQFDASYRLNSMLYALYLLFGKRNNLVGRIGSLILPIKYSAEYIKKTYDEKVRLLIYFSLYGVISVLDFFQPTIEVYLPIYVFLRATILFYPISKWTRGSIRIYRRFLKPYLEEKSPKQQ
uniref:SAM domain-containing protein n=1 Tax=Rhabditophanes sp. KR3021 TaxID=114890 RepID=A0AC35UAL8_9BILA